MNIANKDKTMDDVVEAAQGKQTKARDHLAQALVNTNQYLDDLLAEDWVPDTAKAEIAVEVQCNKAVLREALRQGTYAQGVEDAARVAEQMVMWGVDKQGMRNRIAQAIRALTREKQDG